MLIIIFILYPHLILRLLWILFLLNFVVHQNLFQETRFFPVLIISFEFHNFFLQVLFFFFNELNRINKYYFILFLISFLVYILAFNRSISLNFVLIKTFCAPKSFSRSLIFSSFNSFSWISAFFSWSSFIVILFIW